LYGLFVNERALENIFHSNTIKGSLIPSIGINGSGAAKNIIKNNQLSDSFHGVSLNNNRDTTFTNNTIVDMKKSGYFLGNVSEIKFN